MAPGNRKMAEYRVCGKCGYRQATCTCVCQYPFVFLCEEHFNECHQATDGFHHFRLPLEAAHCIESEESLAKCEKWLFGLDKAHKILRKHCDDFDHFEQKIDAACREIVAELSEVRESITVRIRAARDSFAEQLQAAIEETTLHCAESWTPRENSLSSLIWDFAQDNPANLKVIKLNVASRSIAKALLVRLESSVPCGFQIGEEGTESELLTAEVEQLRNANTTLEASVEELSKTLSETRTALDSAETQIKSLTEASQFAEAHYNRQLSQDASVSAVLAADAEFREERKYQASYELLQQRLRVAERETALLGLALCEVAVHLGNFQEAQKVLDRATQLVTSPEDLPALQCASALVHFHKGEVPETTSICADIARQCHSAEIPADISLIHIICRNKPDFGSTEIVFDRFLELYSDPPPIVTLLAEVAQMYQKDFASAQGYTQQLMETFQRPSTSIYYSMVVAHTLVPDTMRVQQCFALKELISQHFPGSFWYAETLVMLGESLIATTDYDAARTQLKEATEFLLQYFPEHQLSAFACAILASTCVLAGKMGEALNYSLQAKALFGRFEQRQGNFHGYLDTLAKIEKKAKSLGFS